jgi:hypothetical protein
VHSPLLCLTFTSKARRVLVMWPLSDHRDSAFLSLTHGFPLPASKTADQGVLQGRLFLCRVLQPSLFSLKAKHIWFLALFQHEVCPRILLKSLNLAPRLKVRSLYLQALSRF